jgi:hypothetical protein
MHVLVVTAVRYEAGALVGLSMGRADAGTRDWIVQPKEVPVLEVVDHLADSEQVATLFPVGDGQLVPGPNLQIIVLDNGVESVETEGAPPGQCVADLPRLSYNPGPSSRP